MSSPQSCDAPCFGAIGSPLSSFPEFLASNDIPTDLQAAAAIEKARTNLICFQHAIEPLTIRRTELEAVIPPIQRVPNEILADFFARCVDVTKPLDPMKGGAWVVSRVCHRWRAVALACPELWSHFVFPRKPIKHLQYFIQLQLERAPRPYPLFIRIQDHYTISQDVMDLFFAAHAQWEDVTLGSYRYFTQFVKRARSTLFPRLRKLEIYDNRTPRLFPRNADHLPIFDIVRSLPALTNLFMDLRNEYFTTQLRLPWFQLRHCTLRCFFAPDVLWILPLLPLSASVILRGTHDTKAPQAARTVSKISTLEFDNCTRLFTTTVLEVLHAPSLRKLVFSHGCSSAPAPNAVADFLNRSGCALEHLRIEGCLLSNAGVLEILERGSRHGARWTNELVRLDVHQITDLREMLEALGRGAEKGEMLVPNLRTLAVRGTSALEGVDVLALLKSRNPATVASELGQADLEAKNELRDQLLDAQEAIQAEMREAILNTPLCGPDVIAVWEKVQAPFLAKLVEWERGLTEEERALIEWTEEEARRADERAEKIFAEAMDLLVD
ncbi:hypothetical protein FB45DRAFT_1134438 [Roridomyces roridus]|uniref:F-box domain-containing protein n=1 Tax=Roridomyces roridus TaxID=1738132 RepID=A0AAD7C5D5_9AGAR|nr:hypothetical protein FB45DRAFT_1134438 [Roridomyces roridus]